MDRKTTTKFALIETHTDRFVVNNEGYLEAGDRDEMWLFDSKDEIYKKLETMNHDLERVQIVELIDIN